MNVLGKLFPFHGVGWYKLRGMFIDLLMARPDVQHVIRVAGLLCYPSSLKETGLDPNDFKKLRPVSNLPFISKSLEKV